MFAPGCENLVFRSETVYGGSRYIISFKYLYDKKSKGVRSVDRGGHDWGGLSHPAVGVVLVQVLMHK